MNNALPSKQHECSKPGCRVKADCTPVLVVPAHPLSPNQKYEGVRSVLWMPMCRKHFNATTVREFLSGEAIAGVQASIEKDFRANRAIAHWDRAVVQFIGRHSKEFKHYEQIYLQLEAGRPMPGTGLLH